jgi:ATP-dependent DNA ligase
MHQAQQLRKTQRHDAKAQHEHDVDVVRQLPATAKSVPAGDDWLHESKLDGYRWGQIPRRSQDSQWR